MNLLPWLARACNIAYVNPLKIVLFVIPILNAKVNHGFWKLISTWAPAESLADFFVELKNIFSVGPSVYIFFTYLF